MSILKDKGQFGVKTVDFFDIRNKKESNKKLKANLSILVNIFNRFIFIIFRAEIFSDQAQFWKRVSLDQIQIRRKSVAILDG